MTALNQENLHALQMLTKDTMGIFDDTFLKESKMDNKDGISHNKTCNSELTANTSVQTTLSKKRNGGPYKKERCQGYTENYGVQNWAGTEEYRSNWF